MNFKTALHLGRVSNLPTVWSNVLAASFLAASMVDPFLLFLWFLVISLMYVGGMFLNDAYDAEWDRINKPSRPIPSNRVTKIEVFCWGYGFLLSGPILLLLSDLLTSYQVSAPTLVTVVLAVTIVLYDFYHKKMSLAPWLMGVCRLLGYIAVGMAVGGVSASLFWAGLSLLAYIVALTYSARAEHLNLPGSRWVLLLFIIPLVFPFCQLSNFPGSIVFMFMFSGWVVWNINYFLPGNDRNIGKAISGLLAGIPLFDAMILSGVGQWLPACIATLLFFVAHFWHARVAGT